MSKAWETKKVELKDGRCYVDIDITTAEWREMLADETIFFPQALDMIYYWYAEEDHYATSKVITTKYFPDWNATPFNAHVLQLSKRILKHLDRFEVLNHKGDGKKAYWCIPFEGWYEDYNIHKHFIWKLRKELVEAFRDFSTQNRDRVPYLAKHKDVPTVPFITDGLLNLVPVKGKKEGKKIAVYTTKYERQSTNRDIKIQSVLAKNKPLTCEVCGFNFEEVYGEIGRAFIEVHHSKPLSSYEEETVIDPIKDLNCVCSNCHRMLHHGKSGVLTVNQLKARIMKNKS